MKTFSITKKSIDNKWLLINADGLILGRLAAEISKLLRGKHKPTYTPHMHCGDNVIILNAEKIKLTGNKIKNKVYYRHTGYPGGIKQTTPEKILLSKNPTQLLALAVKRMMPKGPLSRKQIKSLKIFVGSNHPHKAQNPKIIDIADYNQKNKR